MSRNQIIAQTCAMFDFLSWISYRQCT